MVGLVGIDFWTFEICVLAITLIVGVLLAALIRRRPGSRSLRFWALVGLAEVGVLVLAYFFWVYFLVQWD